MGDVLFISNKTGLLGVEERRKWSELNGDRVTTVEVVAGDIIIRNYSENKYGADEHDASSEEREAKLRKARTLLLQRIINDITIPEEYILKLAKNMTSEELKRLEEDGLGKKIQDLNLYKTKEKFLIQFIKGIPNDTLKVLYKYYPELKGAISSQNIPSILSIFNKNPEMFQVVLEGNKNIEAVLELVSDKNMAENMLKQLTPKKEATISVVSDHVDYEKNYKNIIIDVGVFDELYNSAFGIRVEIVEKLLEILEGIPENERNLETYQKLIGSLNRIKQSMPMKENKEENSFGVQVDNQRSRIYNLCSTQNNYNIDQEINSIVEEIFGEQIDSIGVLNLAQGKEFLYLKDIFFQLKKRNPEVFVNFESLDLSQQELDTTGASVTREGIKEMVRGKILKELRVKGEEKKFHITAKSEEGQTVSDVGKLNTLVNLSNTNNWEEYLVNLINAFINADTDKSMIDHIVDVSLSSKQFIMSSAFKGIASELSENYKVNGLFTSVKYNYVTSQVIPESLDTEFLITSCLAGFFHDIGKQVTFPDEMVMNAAPLSKVANDKYKSMHPWKGGLLIQDFLMKCENIPPQIRQVMGNIFEVALFHHALTNDYSLPEEAIVLDETSPEYIAARKAGLPFYIKPPEKGRTYEESELKGHKNIDISNNARMFIAISELSDQLSAIARLRGYNRIQPIEYNIMNICSKFGIKLMSYEGEEIYSKGEEISLSEYMDKLQDGLKESKDGAVDFSEYICFEPNNPDDVSLEQVVAMSFLYNVINEIYWQDEKTQAVAKGEKEIYNPSDSIIFYEEGEIEDNPSLKAAISTTEKFCGKKGTHWVAKYQGSNAHSEGSETNRTASKLDIAMISDIFRALVVGKYKGKEINREQLMTLIAGENPFKERRTLEGFAR